MKQEVNVKERFREVVTEYLHDKQHTEEFKVLLRDFLSEEEIDLVITFVDKLKRSGSARASRTLDMMDKAGLSPEDFFSFVKGDYRW